jgi:putative transposase
MKLARSTYYYRGRRGAAKKKVLRDRIEALCAEFPTRRLPAYHPPTSRRGNGSQSQGSCATDARKRPPGATVAQVRTHHGQRPRWSDLPNLVRGFRPTGRDQLWVGDITYIRISAGFVYLAVILDAWSRLGRRVDVGGAECQGSMRSRLSLNRCTQKAVRGAGAAAFREIPQTRYAGHR